MPPAFDWRTAPADQVEREYSPSRRALRPIDEHLADYARASAAAGDPLSLRLPGRPLLIYVHGGYWQELSAAESLFNAADARRERVSLVAVEYTLAPRATIDTMVNECLAAMRLTIATLAPSRVVVAGSSAGAHLVAACLAGHGSPVQIDAAVLLSGIYDLRPLTRTSINDALGLTLCDAERLSPVLASFDALPPLLVALGAHETSEFTRQSREMAAHLRAAGADVTEAEVSARDHFDLPADLLARGTVVGDWVLARLTAPVEPA